MLERGDKIRLKQPEKIRCTLWNLFNPSNQQAYVRLVGHTLTVSDKMFSAIYNKWLYSLRDDCCNKVPFRVFESEVVKVSDKANKKIENEFAALIF